MKYSAIIPCGGIGSRLNLGYNKILYKINDKLLIERTINNFILDEDCLEVVIVYQKDDYKLLNKTIKHPKVKFVLGGATREESVYNGLKMAISEYVLIHDGARPNVNKELIERIKNKLNDYECVIPVVKSKDATLIDKEYHTKEILLIQTPQALNRELLIKAMEQVDLSKFKDDGSVYSYVYKKEIGIVEGDYSNIKVTTIDDLSKIKEEE